MTDTKSKHDPKPLPETDSDKCDDAWREAVARLGETCSLDEWRKRWRQSKKVK